MAQDDPTHRLDAQPSTTSDASALPIDIASISLTTDDIDHPIGVSEHLPSASVPFTPAEEPAISTSNEQESQAKEPPAPILSDSITASIAQTSSSVKEALETHPSASMNPASPPIVEATPPPPLSEPVPVDTPPPTTNLAPPPLHSRSHSQGGPAKEYSLKVIQWKYPGRDEPVKRVNIIMQNENGPCPLLALCNVLLLRGDIKISLDRSTVTYERLVDLIGDYLLARTQVSYKLYCVILYLEQLMLSSFVILYLFSSRCHRVTHVLIRFHSLFRVTHVLIPCHPHLE
ncbi:hypothetical protein BC829DRAFT_69136 [Chytridium lagenaria]|nr:hypothetical protein BC829DRAFT_69136 [Chytridium lagenaria]